MHIFTTWLTSGSFIYFGFSGVRGYKWFFLRSGFVYNVTEGEILIQCGVLAYNTKAQYDTVSMPKRFLPG